MANRRGILGGILASPFAAKAAAKAPSEVLRGEAQAFMPGPSTFAAQVDVAQGPGVEHHFRKRIDKELRSFILEHNNIDHTPWHLKSMKSNSEWFQAYAYKEWRKKRTSLLQQKVEEAMDKFQVPPSLRRHLLRYFLPHEDCMRLGFFMDDV